MPKLSRQVVSTDRQIRALTASTSRREYRIAGIRNLIIRVTPDGTKSWNYLYRAPGSGKRRKITLGRYPGMGLLDAKSAALRLSVKLTDGDDPQATLCADQTFEALAHGFLQERFAQLKKSGRRPTWVQEEARLLEIDILPWIGGKRAGEVAKVDVREVVQRVRDRGSFGIADKVLGVTRTVYRWAIATGRLEADPTAGLKKQHSINCRERTLTDPEISAFWEATEHSSVSRPIRRILQLQTLLGLRVGEAAGSRRDEVDLERGLWLIPAVRTKSRRDLTLPLPPQAARILRESVADAAASPWLFPSVDRDEHVRPKSVSRAMLRLATAINSSGLRTHDLRRTCATGLGNLDVPDEVIDRILNHAPRSVARRHYNHARQIEAMWDGLSKWDAHVTSVVCPARQRAWQSVRAPITMISSAWNVRDS